MKILFVYSAQKTIVPEKPLLGQEGIYHGLSSVAGMLHSNGYECDLLVLDRVNRKKNVCILKDKVEKFNPSIVAFTAVFSEFEFICQIAKQVKIHYSNLFLIAGGVHITLNPDESYLSLFDAICIGEGEYPMLELVERLEQQKPIDGIQNLWVKTELGIKKNPVRPFIEDLDNLAFSYRAMWQQWILNPMTKPTVLLGRGCPYKCTYCCNHKLRKIACHLRRFQNQSNHRRLAGFCSCSCFCFGIGSGMDSDSGRGSCFIFHASAYRHASLPRGQ